MITIANTNENNLKSITLNLPSNKIIVVTGVSGSGKSTLVYDVIFKEAQRRYLESFSANARQFLGKMSRPDVQFMGGLSPAIALQQRSTISSPRSTVGTITEIYDLLRLLFARIGNATNKNIEVNRNLFSFNSAKGACPTCKGLGLQDWIDPELLIADAKKTIRQGAFVMTTPSGYIVYSQVTMAVLNQVCQAEGFTVDIPWKDLTPAQKKVILYGSKKIKIPFGKHPLESRMKWTGITAKPRDEGYYKGIVPIMEEILIRDRNPNVLRFARSKPCESCHGSRLNSAALSVKTYSKNIAEIAALTLDELIEFFEGFKKAENNAIAIKIIGEILKTAKTIQKLGLGFLTLNRSAETLSGGETQRLRLAKLVSSEMRGILYIFDEPSVGLHPEEIKNLMEVFYALRNNGNTIILVEHNEQVIQNAEWIVDLGPEAGDKGGKVLYNGAIKDFLKEKESGQSQTLYYLNNPAAIKKSDTLKKSYFEILGASAHNLNNIDVKFQLNALNVICGVSGAGKSSLIDSTLAQYFHSRLNDGTQKTGPFKKIVGAEPIAQLQIIDQKPIGKTPRSNPATYTGLSDEIRNIFASLPDSNKKGLGKNHFSFNTKGGRCPKCEGAGYEQIGMQMIGTVELICSQCNGNQFKDEVLEIKYKDKSIAEIYNLTIDEATQFFSDEPKVLQYLNSLLHVGLGYLKLNQRSSTLSGGEARRVKLALGLAKIPKKHTLYIIDEPSSGLHAFDIQVLLKNLQSLIDKGHTIILVEQNDRIIKKADHIIELGPGSGKAGGNIVFQGTPQDLIKHADSKIAQAILGKINSQVNIKTNVFDLYNPIELKGVTTHNLKNIDVEFPVNRITSLVGVSGSGKSSLAFDTLFAEGRQRYAESFSPYIRNRLNINSEANYEIINGLMPTIDVDQKNISQSNRSTVGTITDIYDYLRLLFARIGKGETTREKPLASHFSFNSEQGACPVCQGLGYQIICDAEKLISNPEKSILNGAMDGSKPGKFYGDINGQYIATLKAVGKKHGIDFNTAWNKLPVQAKDLALNGTNNKIYKIDWEFKRKNREGVHKFEGTWPGLLHYVNDEFLRKALDKRSEALMPVMKQVECTTCNGSRLNQEALKYKVLGLTIHEMSQIPITQLLQEFRKQVVVPQSFSNNNLEQRAAQILAGSIINGLDILDKLGLGYLTLGRSAKTLSGGEGQRVRLASGMAQDIAGVCFVLDEPTMGLHPKDLDNLFFMLYELKRQGNTVVVCEHDPGFIRYSDYVIELGPGGGALGGEIIDQGEVKYMLKSEKSIIGKYLSDDYTFIREKKSPDFKQVIEIEGASANNLKNINICIPSHSLVVLTGVSGSGKSSLLNDVLYQSYKTGKNTNCKKITGFNHFHQVIWAGQNLPKGHALSFVASYLGLFDYIRDAFVNETKEKHLNFNKSHFSVLGKEGKCPDCSGKGYIKTSMDFMSDIYETCGTCQGKRFNTDVLGVKLNNQDISEVLNTSFSNLKVISSNKKLGYGIDFINQFGLGYLSAGQTLNTLSGGELQRLKLVKTLLENNGEQTLFLLDEPTTGLHMLDVEKLMVAFDNLLEKGHSLMVVEHHKTVVDNADFTIELGPGAGDEGGKLVKFS